MRLLVADDESYTREGIIDSIDWNGLGVTEIMQAKDGREALQISAWFNPDIVITDIKMPKLNGIEFAEKLIKQCPNSKLMFMSGYVEIEYLKKAIDLSAVDYIEKPVDTERLKASVLKAVKLISERKKIILSEMEKRELQRMNLANLLRYKDIDFSIAAKICAEIDFPVKATYQSIAVWYKRPPENRDRAGQALYTFWAEKEVNCLHCYLEDNRYLVILAYKREDGKRIEYLMSGFCRLSEDISIGIGFETENLSGIHPSTEIALLNVEQAFYKPDLQMFNLNKDVLTKKNLNPHLFTEFGAIMKESSDELIPWLNKLFQNIREIGCYSRKQILALFTSFIRLLMSEGGAALYMPGGEEDIEKYISDIVSIDELEVFITGIAGAYAEKVGSRGRFSKLTQDIIAYLETHCQSHELKASDIADHLHFSVSHLNMLFKTETGVTIKQYIDDYRVELAKKMLIARPHDKINEIALKCGYSNLNYFSKVFKSTTGLRPAEYRKRNVK